MEDITSSEPRHTNVDTIIRNGRLQFSDEAMLDQINMDCADIDRIAKAPIPISFEEFKTYCFEESNPELAGRIRPPHPSIVDITFSSPEEFFRYLEVAMGEEYAIDQLVHELEHVTFFHTNGVSTELKARIAKAIEGGYHFVPYTKALFPEYMPDNEKERLVRLANRKVTNPSEGDQHHS